MYVEQKKTRIFSKSFLNCFSLDTCQGDSGGPIMYFSPSKRRWILTGIISYGYQCDLREYAGVYTRISVYVNWIRSIVGNDGIVTVPESSAIISNTSNRYTIFFLTLTILFCFL